MTMTSSFRPHLSQFSKAEGLVPAYPSLRRSDEFDAAILSPPRSNWPSSGVMDTF
jgi:hypothetical protein